MGCRVLPAGAWGVPHRRGLQPLKRDCKGRQPFAGARGVPEKPFFFFFTRRLRRRGRKRKIWGHPKTPAGRTLHPLSPRLWGCPQKLLFSLLAAAGGEQKEEKGFFGDTPSPGRRLPPSAHPRARQA